MNNSDHENLSIVRRLCHKLCASSCVEQKRSGLHIKLLELRPHWSATKKEEQDLKIDQGEMVPFDIALPLPARDLDDPDSDQGLRLFWETFRCQRCGRCCYSPGAGLYLELEDHKILAECIGEKRLRKLCRYDRRLNAWVLRQPCPFYDIESKDCRIYEFRPLTCTKYPLHPPIEEMPYNLAVDAFCPAARQLAKDTLGWWIICENNWARMLSKFESSKR